MNVQTRIKLICIRRYAMLSYVLCLRRISKVRTRFKNGICTFKATIGNYIEPFVIATITLHLYPAIERNVPLQLLSSVCRPCHQVSTCLLICNCTFKSPVMCTCAPAPAPQEGDGLCGGGGGARPAMVDPPLLGHGHGARVQGGKGSSEKKTG